MEKNKVKYIIISPVRNEEKNIGKTIQSVLSQTIRPMRWIIVDDGSSDKTISIIEEYIKNNNWISLLKLADRGYYDLMTGGEIKAFFRGYELVKNMDYEFIIKLDGDISFDEFYFEKLFNEFKINNKLGIASGACYHYEGDKLVLERAYKLHVRGAARAYRRQCWKDIGGVIDGLGWDAMDVYKARMLGWETYNFEEIRMIHHVKTGTKGGSIHGYVRTGRLEFLIGYHPIFFLFRCIMVMSESPYIISGFACLFGYLTAFLKNEKRVVEDDLMRYIRMEQKNRIISAIRNPI
jgi:biofilm PGA synthesis N-glycosyltransferase PgaC